MLDIILRAFMIAFGIACGLGLGCGNRGGIATAIIVGIIGGAVVAIPMWRDHLWFDGAQLLACVLAGSIICTFVPDTLALKQWCRGEQTGLHIKIGSYELGKSDPNDESH